MNGALYHHVSDLIVCNCHFPSWGFSYPLRLLQRLKFTLTCSDIISVCYCYVILFHVKLKVLQSTTLRSHTMLSTVHATSTSEHPPRAQHNSRPGGQSREGKTHISAFTELTCWWRRCWMSTDGPYAAELGKAHTASQQIWKRARRHREHGP